MSPSTTHELKPIVPSRSQWLLKSNYPLSNEVINSFEEVVSRLKKHEPIQYIFGECEFNGLMFKLSPACTNQSKN
ncbi:hypothetical protein N9Y89_00810 [bacterium]|nr:hypothetical protein [bacterium]